jgi:hypothetical protein
MRLSKKVDDSVFHNVVRGKATQMINVVRGFNPANPARLIT